MNFYRIEKKLVQLSRYHAMNFQRMPKFYTFWGFFQLAISQNSLFLAQYHFLDPIFGQFVAFDMVSSPFISNVFPTDFWEDLAIWGDLRGANVEGGAEYYDVTYKGGRFSRNTICLSDFEGSKRLIVSDVLIRSFWFLLHFFRLQLWFIVSQWN